MEKRRRIFVSAGIPSLFLIFSVLCLVILALLTLGTSRSDLRMSRLSMEQTTAYYEACGAAADLCRETDELVRESFRQTAGEEEYFSRMDTLPGKVPGLSWDEKTRQITFHTSVNESQSLLVVLRALYPAQEGDSRLEIVTWKTEAEGTWTPDTKQPVFKGETQ